MQPKTNVGKCDIKIKNLLTHKRSLFVSVNIWHFALPQSCGCQNKVPCELQRTCRRSACSTLEMEIKMDATQTARFTSGRSVQIELANTASMWAVWEAQRCRARHQSHSFLSRCSRWEVSLICDLGGAAETNRCFFLNIKQQKTLCFWRLSFEHTTNIDFF